MIVYGVYLFIASSLSFTCVSVARAYRSEIKLLRGEAKYNKHPHARKYRLRPQVTVIVYAYNNETTLLKCLNSIQASSYKKKSILVIDNASTDRTNQIIRSVTLSKNTRIIRRRSKKSRADCLVYATKNIKTGCTFIIDADMFIEKDTIKKLVLQSQISDKGILLPALELTRANSLLNLLNQLLVLKDELMKKSGWRWTQIDSRSIFFKIGLIKNISKKETYGFFNKNTLPNYSYCTDALVHIKSVHKLIRYSLLSLFESTAALALLAASFIYNEQSLSLLLLTLFVVRSTLIIMTSNSYRLIEKCCLLFIVPALYFPYIIYIIVNTCRSGLSRLRSYLLLYIPKSA